MTVTLGFQLMSEMHRQLGNDWSPSGISKG